MRTTFIMQEAGGYLTKKNPHSARLFRHRGRLFRLTSFHFLLLFFTVCNFCKLLFIVQGSLFLKFFIACNFHKLLFTVEKGQGNCFISYIHCSGGKGVP
jgi:hypothetical protein